MPRPAPGLTLSDRFTLVRELGHGAMGTVWLAEDQHLGTRVALKILAAELTASPTFVALLRDENHKASRLLHPNIVRVHEFFASDDSCYISMQYIDGPTLGHRVLNTFSAAVECVLSLCDAIEYAHRSGIVHRDIKPANVLRDSAGHYYLSDFGVAGMVADDAQSIRLRGGGSLPSMSPQQLDGEPASVADDIYALGALLYELLSGAPLFHPDPTPQRIREEQPPALTVDQSGAEIPGALVALVRAMLDKNPARRPAGIAAVRSILEEIRADYCIEQTGAAPTGEVAGSATETVIRPRRRPGSGTAGSINGPEGNNAPQPVLMQAGKQGPPLRFVLAGLGVLVAIAIGVVFLLPTIVEERGALVTKPGSRPAPESHEEVEETTVVAPAVDPAIVAAQRARADEVLGEILTVEERLRLIGVENWGGDDWLEAGRLAETGDAAYRERDYATALTSHRQALERMHLLESRAPEVFARALLDGGEALIARNQNVAIQQFEIALLIQPGQPDAQHGLQRALRLDRVLDLMNQAAEAERVDDWPAAESLYRQALELDAEWQPAIESLGRVLAAIDQAGFETHMAAGFSAVQRQEYTQARQAFRSALKTRPGNPAAIEALRQIDADEELRKIVALRLAARAAEGGERWPEAVRNYTEILTIDPKIEAVSRDLQRARDRAQLAVDLDSAIADADRFYEDRVARQAAVVLARAHTVLEPGPKLTGQMEQLDGLLRIAAIPVPVRFESDNMTDVVIYKVGRLGLFTTRTIDLKPGSYVASGTRDGYRDVRRTFRVGADGAMAPIVLTCEEPI